MEIKVDIGIGWDNLNLPAEKLREILQAIDSDLETLAQVKVKRHKGDTNLPCNLRDISLRGSNIRNGPQSLKYYVRDKSYSEARPHGLGPGYCEIGEQEYTHQQLEESRKTKA